MLRLGQEERGKESGEEKGEGGGTRGEGKGVWRKGERERAGETRETE